MLKEKIANNPAFIKFKKEFYESETLQKFNGMYNKVRDKILNSSLIKKCHISGDLLFCIAFVLYYLVDMVESTMFYSPTVKLYLDMVPFLVIVIVYIKLLVFDTGNKQRFIKIMIPASIIGIFVSMAAQAGKNYQLMNVFILLLGAYNVNFRKVALSSVIAGGITVVSVTIMSLFGLLPDLVYESVRHSFGFIYPTDYAAHCFFILLTYFWYRKGKLKWFENAVFIVIAAFLMYFCRAKLDSLCIVILVIAGIIYNNKYGMKIYSKLRYVIVYSVFAAAVISIFVTLIYTTDNPVLNSIPSDTIISRLKIGHMMLFRHGTTFFGQYVSDAGYGGSLTPPEEYTFIDVSYVRILIKSGIFILLLLIIALTVFLRKRIQKNDYVTGIVFLLIAINCMIAQHMIDVSYNIFLFIILANLKEYDMPAETVTNSKLKKA